MLGVNISCSQALREQSMLANLPTCPPACGYAAHRSVRSTFYFRHIAIRQPEMMANFMDQHVPNNVAQQAASQAPLLKKWPTIEEDNVDILHDSPCPLFSKRDAAI